MADRRVVTLETRLESLEHELDRKLTASRCPRCGREDGSAGGRCCGLGAGLCGYRDEEVELASAAAIIKEGLENHPCHSCQHDQRCLEEARRRRTAGTRRTPGNRA